MSEHALHRPPCGPWKLRWIAAVTLALLSSCNPVTRDASADQAAQSFFDQVRQHQTEAFTSRFDPALQNPKTKSSIEQVERLIPPGVPRQRLAVGTNTFMSPSGTTVLATDEYDYEDRKALVQTRLYRASDTQEWAVQGFNVRIATLSQLKANDFGLTGKSAAQYAFLAFLVASPLLIILALVKVLRTAGLRRKWLWCAASVLGIGQVQMNWATGAVSFNPLSLHLFGVGFWRASSSFAPWILTAALPIGAVLILIGILASPDRARKATTHVS